MVFGQRVDLPLAMMESQSYSLLDGDFFHAWKLAYVSHRSFRLEAQLMLFFLETIILTKAIWGIRS